MDVYEPREDSELLKKHIKKYAKGNVLDMGTGSGILAVEAAKYANMVLALDINQKAIDKCKEAIDNHKILFAQSDLFQIIELGKIQRKFNLMIFNPPYLPNDKYPNIALDGGKEGYELVQRFLSRAKNHLEKNGTILLLVSSLTNKPKIQEILKKEGYKYEVLDKESHGFETLYVYEVNI